MHIKNSFRLKIQIYFEGTETLLTGGDAASPAWIRRVFDPQHLKNLMEWLSIALRNRGQKAPKSKISLSYIVSWRTTAYELMRQKQKQTQNLEGSLCLATFPHCWGCRHTGM